MSGSFKRAIGHWAVSQIETLHAYADDLANARHRYPAVVVTELTHDTKSMGCGKTEYVVRDTESGFVSRTGKMSIVETNYRLTITAPSDRENNGQEIVDDILETLESAALMTWLSAGLLELIDPGCDHPVTTSDLNTELTRFDGIWDELFPVERARIMSLLVESVTISETGIDLELRADGIGSLIAEIGGESSCNLH